MTAAERIAELFDHLSDQTEVRLVDPSRSKLFTGQQLARRYQQAITRLSATAITEGSPVLFAVRPSPTALAFLGALVTIGVPPVLTDLRLPTQVVKSQLARIEVSAVLTTPSAYLASLRPVRRLLQNKTEVPELHQLAGTVVTTRPRLHRRLEITPPRDNDAALIVFTSGTTGAPKGVAHTQHTLEEMLTSLVALMGAADNTVVYSDQFHSLVPALAVGARCVIGDPSISDADLADVLQHQNVDVWFTSPSRARRVLSRIGERSPRHLVLGSAPVTRGLLAELKRTSPHARITAVYGMTEAVPVAVAEAEEIAAHRGPGEFVGRVADGIEVRIAEDGELWIRGPRVGHYLDVKPGWIPTGDAGHTDDQGRIILDGRRKDMILKDGRNIYPQHYEPFVNAIDGVIECALVGVADTYGDEEVWLVLETMNDPGDTIQSVRHVPELEGLELDGIVFARLPRGHQNKVDRVACRDLVRQAQTDGTTTTLHPS